MVNYWYILCCDVILVCIQYSTASESLQCGHGISTPGVTVPRGDIILLEGRDSLEIFCRLNTSHSDAKGLDASNLVFYRNANKLEPQFINIVNETTIRLFVENPPASHSHYYCKINNPYTNKETAVCLNLVSVGSKPKHTTDFNCISRNWQNLTCQWQTQQHYVKTDYRLLYKLPGRAGSRQHYKCPNQTIEVNKQSCFWDMSTEPHYRQPYQLYFFTMYINNTFGNITENRTFQHYAHVIPGKPASLEVLNYTSHSAFLEWKVSHGMENFPEALDQRVIYKSQYSSINSSWTAADLSQLITGEGKHYKLNITSLKYAYTWYDVRVSMKSSLAADIDRMWSQFRAVTFRTKGELPGNPPTTDTGSFELSGSQGRRDVILYWKQIPDYQRNGDNFEYKVVEIYNGTNYVNVQPNETTSAYAKFTGLKHNSYNFTIVSSNKEGYSKGRSYIHIPRVTESVNEPIAFTKIAFGDVIYELSWKRPEAQRGILVTSYTLFWCKNERDRPYQCTGQLEWERVSADIHIHNVTVPDSQKIYQFAISANTDYASSGMVWASCTVLHNQVVGKMKNIWLNHVGSTFIEVGWKLYCSDRVGIVNGFRIYYCVSASPYTGDCKESMQNVTISGDANLMKGNLTSLRPYTTYMVAVSVVTRNGEGLQSNPQYWTTLESNPSSPPLEFKVDNVRNTSFHLQWKPPIQMNGVLRYYMVLVKEGIFILRKEKVEKEYTELTVLNLTSFTNYTVTVSACTVTCSEESFPIMVETLKGKPGQIPIPQIKFINGTIGIITWEKPKIAGGTLDRYEVKLVVNSEGKNSTKSYHTTDTRYVIPELICDELSRVFQFSVRAINDDKVSLMNDSDTDNKNSKQVKDIEYLGPWSEPVENYCAGVGTNAVAFWIPTIIGISFGVGFLFFACKRLWARCKNMQNIEVKLPPGLSPTIEKEPRYPLNNWPSPQKPSNDSADEVSLLPDKSSGCGSTTDHTSATSSLNSGTASTDSEPISSGDWNSTLRQRNVPAGKQTLHSNIVQVAKDDLLHPSMSPIIPMDDMPWMGQPGYTKLALGNDPHSHSVSDIPTLAEYNNIRNVKFNNVINSDYTTFPNEKTIRFNNKICDDANKDNDCPIPDFDVDDVNWTLDGPYVALPTQDISSEIGKTPPPSYTVVSSEPIMSKTPSGYVTAVVPPEKGYVTIPAASPHEMPFLDTMGYLLKLNPAMGRCHDNAKIPAASPIASHHSLEEAIPQGYVKVVEAPISHLAQKHGMASDDSELTKAQSVEHTNAVAHTKLSTKPSSGYVPHRQFNE